MDVQPLVRILVIGTLGLTWHMAACQDNSGHSMTMSQVDGSMNILEQSFLGTGIGLLVVGVVASGAALLYICIWKRRESKDKGPKGIRELAQSRPRPAIHNVYSPGIARLHRPVQENHAEGQVMHSSAQDVTVQVDSQVDEVDGAPDFAVDMVPDVFQTYDTELQERDAMPIAQQPTNLDGVGGGFSMLYGVPDLHIYHNIHEDVDIYTPDCETDSDDESDFEVPPARRPNTAPNSDARSTSSENEPNAGAAVEHANSPNQTSNEDTERDICDNQVEYANIPCHKRAEATDKQYSDDGSDSGYDKNPCHNNAIQINEGERCPDSENVVEYANIHTTCKTNLESGAATCSRFPAQPDSCVPVMSVSEGEPSDVNMMENPLYAS